MVKKNRNIGQEFSRLPETTCRKSQEKYIHRKIDYDVEDIVEVKAEPQTSNGIL